MTPIFRDQRDLPYEELLRRREELSSIHTVFSLVALVRDVSQEGLGIKFEGQQMMAANLLKPSENYIVKLTLVMAEAPGEVRAYVRREGSYHFLLLKMTCRWHESTENVSTAGFALRSNNPPALVEFVREHFGLDIEPAG